MNFRVLPEANHDALAGALWYDEQQLGLGERFAAALKIAFETIELHPTRAARIPKYRGSLELRQILVIGFPYSIVYLHRDTETLVIAVSHSKRRPLYWLRRLDGI